MTPKHFVKTAAIVFITLFACFLCYGCFKAEDRGSVFWIALAYSIIILGICEDE